jgi:hypothetical protein
MLDYCEYNASIIIENKDRRSSLIGIDRVSRKY